MYPTSAIVTGGQLAIAMLVLLSYPLQIHPCRASLHKVLYRDKTSSNFVPLTLCIMAASLIIAISVQNLSTVLSVVGATGSTTICYILPGLFYYKLNGGGNVLMRGLAIGMVVMGVLVMGSSLCALGMGLGGGH